MEQSNGDSLVADRQRHLRLDEVGYWTEIKLEIVKRYAREYTKILSSQQKKGKIREFVYIDAFAGAGVHISRTTGGFVAGSPLNALSVEPKFSHFYFIDTDGAKVDELRNATAGRDDVTVLEGDCNEVLLKGVFPKVNYKDYRRGLCLLDPYGLHLSWDVIRAAGKSRAIDLFLNFPVMDMNMNVLWSDPRRVDPKQAKRLTSYWGDQSWRDAIYRPEPDLFDQARLGKVAEANEAVAGAFRSRLKAVAGFANVPEPLPMRNTKGATVYYLFFASQKAVANEILKYIFDEYGQGRHTVT